MLCAHCDTDNGTLGGACTLASPFENKVAKDCKTIPHADKVICAKGTCKVQSCKDGYEVSSSQDSCVKPRLNRIRDDTSDGIDKFLASLDSMHLLPNGTDTDSIKAFLLTSVEKSDCGNFLKAIPTISFSNFAECLKSFESCLKSL